MYFLLKETQLQKQWLEHKGCIWEQYAVWVVASLLAVKPTSITIILASDFSLPGIWINGYLITHHYWTSVMESHYA